MKFAGLVKYGKRGSTYTGAISTAYAVANGAWLVLWHDDILRVLPTREEAEHYASQLTTEGVVPLHPRREEKARKAREGSKKKVAEVFENAASIMAEDPGFKAAERQREAERKANKLKYGRQLFRVGDSVVNHDRESIPWVGLVMSAEYRDYDIDGAGWYYEVDWWNDKLSQRHQGYAHQDFLRPL